MNPIDELYIGCINCNKTNTDCPGITKNKAEGMIPKGFYFQTNQPTILIVAKNPGHPLEDEQERYIGKTDIEIYEAHKQFVKDIFNGSDLTTTFHKNLKRYIKHFLDIEQKLDKDIFNYVCYTNLVKCTTTEESGIIKTQTKQNCYSNYLSKEIELFKPKVILALGNEVANFLNKKKLKIPIIIIKHPSYYYKREKRNEILDEKRDEIKLYL